MEEPSWGLSRGWAQPYPNLPGSPILFNCAYSQVSVHQMCCYSPCCTHTNCNYCGFGEKKWHFSYLVTADSQRRASKVRSPWGLRRRKWLCAFFIAILNNFKWVIQAGPLGYRRIKSLHKNITGKSWELGLLKTATADANLEKEFPCTYDGENAHCDTDLHHLKTMCSPPFLKLLP